YQRGQLADGNLVAGVYGAAGDLDPATNLDAGRDLVLGHAAVAYGEDLGEAGELIQRLLRNHYRGGVAGERELDLDEHAGAKLGIAFGQAGLDGERARVGIQRGVEFGDAGVELGAGGGIGGEDERTAG